MTSQLSCKRFFFFLTNSIHLTSPFLNNPFTFFVMAAYGPDLNIAQKSYKGYLKTVNENSSKLLGEIVDDLEYNKGIQIINNLVVSNLLRTLSPGRLSTSRSEFDRNRVQHGQKITRTLIKAEKVFDIVKIYAQIVDATGSDYEQINHYSDYEKSIPKSQIASYHSSKDFNHIYN